MYSAILVDAGGILLDEQQYETETRNLIVEILNKYLGKYTESDYNSDLDESITCFSPHNRQYIFWKYCDKDSQKYSILWNQFLEKWNSIEHVLVLMKGIEDEIYSLSQKYEIIIAGQYGNGLIEILRQNNLVHYFKNTLTQENFNITKPDPRYFEQICSRSNVEPNRCIMVGDRIDKDVIPAKQNRMGTVFVKSGVYRNQKVRTLDEVPDLILENTIGMARIIKEKFV